MILRFLILFFVFVSCASAEGNLDKVRSLARSKAKKAEAVTMAMSIIEDNNHDAGERSRLKLMLPSLQINAGELEAARSTLANWKSSGDQRLSALANVVEAEILNHEGKRAEAITLLRSLLNSVDKVVKGEAHYLLVKILSVDEKGKPTKLDMTEVVGLAETAFACLEDPFDIKDVLDIGQRAAERSKNKEAYEIVQRHFLAEPMYSYINKGERDDHARRLGKLLMEAKRYEEAKALYAQQLIREDTNCPEWHLAIANCWMREEKKAEVLAACEAVFHAGADVNDWAVQAQRLVLGCLGDDPKVLASAALTWYQTENSKEAAENIGRYLGGADKAKVTAITNWYRFGSKGEDGIAGTADDLKNPKLGLKPMEFPKRLAAARSVELTNGVMARRRVALLMWAGKPEEAVQVARWWLRMGRSAAEFGSITDSLALAAVALTGDASVRADELLFLAYGPAGVDGQLGTADDLKDLLPKLPLFEPPAPKKEDMVLLERLRDAAASIAGDETLRDRNEGFSALLKIDILLNRTPKIDEVLPWFRFNASGVHDMVCAATIAKAGHLGELNEAFSILDNEGWGETPDYVKKRRNNWTDLLEKVRSGKPYKSWWP